MPPTEYVGPLEPIDDEFDKQAFGEIPRLALLQDLLTRLRNNGVNVIAGTYTYSWLRGLREDERPLFSDDSQIWVCVPREDTRRIFQTERVLSIHLVPSDVEEEVVPIKTGLSLEDFERHDGPF